MNATEIIPQNVREYKQMLSDNAMIERAINLNRDGYHIDAVTEVVGGRIKPVLGQFVVTSPAGNDYDVDVIQQKCSCTYHRLNGCCKHRSGVYRAGCRQANMEMNALWNFRHTGRGFVRYIEAERLLSALEAARVVCQRRMAQVAA